jgi:hypothetical protein
MIALSVQGKLEIWTVDTNTLTLPVAERVNDFETLFLLNL